MGRPGRNVNNILWRGDGNRTCKVTKIRKEQEKVNEKDIFWILQFICWLGTENLKTLIQLNATDVKVGPLSRLSIKELMLSNCDAREDSWDPLGLQGDPKRNPRINQPWIFIGRTDVEAENPILWPPDSRANSLEKTLILGKIEGKRRRGQQWMRWLDRITDSMDMN